MRISDPTREAVHFVALKMRERDFAEFSAVSYASTREELADVMAERYGSFEGCIVGHAGENPACVGATVMARPNVVSLLFFATDQFPEIALPATRFIKRELFSRLKKTGVHRIEAVSMVDHNDAHAWLQTLGLERETEPMRGYGKNGEAFVQFAWVSDDSPIGP
ncbi:N-acetyltransferase domain-containing protein [Shinella sp. WSC3-e]|nr:conserved hypothetical protein [Rhizobiaceae bacterium]CAK7259097.1 N-acetyltransferase domain-containing protein [Shinella sp. WSC3-e]